jgi:hypothetical protein
MTSLGRSKKTTGSWKVITAARGTGEISIGNVM